MHKLLFLLLYIPALLSAQKVDYYAKRDSTWKVVRDVAVEVVTPDNYGTHKKWPVVFAIHGVGERSSGTIDNLKNLYLGFDYNNDGFREGPAFVTDDMKKAVNLYGIVLVVPTYETTQFFEPTMVNSVYDFVKSKYSVVDKMLITGFSYGGGATIKYVSSSTANAARVAYAVPCAATNSLADATIPGKASVPVHAFSNDNDNVVNVSNTKTFINAINATNPALKALMTIFRRDGHGSNVEAWSLTPPKAPGGTGFTDAAENIYQVYLDILANGPRQMKAGAVINPTPTDPPPTTTKTAIVSYTQAGNVIILDGSKSTGYTSGLEGTWSLISAPAGVSSWDVFPKGSNYITAGAILPKIGTYSFQFKLDTEIKTVSITYGKAPVKYDPVTGLLTYSDGSTEKVTVAAVKTSTGEVIQL